MKSLELRFVQVDFGLSARRLYETTELGQINVFGHPLNVEHEITDATKFIDVIRYQGEDFYLAGFTLAELQNGRAPGNDTVDIDAVLKACNETRALSTFIVIVHSHLVRCSLRQGMRNMQQPFLSSSSAHVCFGIRHIYSNLQAKLAALSNSKANAQQWLKTIDNFQKKGLRAEELEMSNLCRKLLACNDKAKQFTGLELANICQFDSLQCKRPVNPSCPCQQ